MPARVARLIATTLHPPAQSARQASPASRDPLEPTCGTPSPPIDCVLKVARFFNGCELCCRPVSISPGELIETDHSSRALPVYAMITWQAGEKEKAIEMLQRALDRVDDSSLDLVYGWPDQLKWTDGYTVK